MSSSAVNLLMHPVRLRIVNALSGARTLTTAQLCERMPETSKATIYRHVERLAAGGVLLVASETLVGGAVERQFRLRQDRVRIDANAAAAMSHDDHRHLFTAAMAALIAEFNAYLDRGHADPYADSVSYRQFVAWLSEAELAELVGELRAILFALAGRGPTPDRRPYLLSTIMFPTEARTGSAPGE